MIVNPRLLFRLITALMSVAFVQLIGCDTDESVSSEPLNAAPPVSSTGQVPESTQTDESPIGDAEDADDSAEDGANADDSATPEAEALPRTELTFMPLSDGGDVVSFVEVDRYMGVWYEIATTPSFQQRSCSNTQASYEFNEEEGWVDVVNTCYVGGPDGRPQQIQGRAELVDLDTQAKLTVIFFGQRAPYWVVALDGKEGTEPYQWAVVSVPGGRTMWILSRTPTISDSVRSEINLHLESRGFGIDRLVDTPQTN